MKDSYILATFAAAVLLGFILTFGDNYLTDIFVSTCLFAMVAVAWNLAAGITGLLSLGHAFFFGIGAYTVAFGLVQFNASPWLTWPAVIVLCAASSIVIGALFFRYHLKGHFFAIGTLAIGEIAFLIVSSTDWLGRSDGMLMPIRRQPLLYWQFEEKWPYAVIVAVLVLLALALAAVLKRSRFGLFWQSIRDNEEAAEALGVPTFRYKVAVLAVSAIVTGIGGALYANYFLFIDPRSVLGVDVSIRLLVFAIVGGMRTYWGPALGAFLLFPSSEFIHGAIGTQFTGLSTAMYSVMVIVLAMFFPKGLAGLISR